MLTHGTMYWGSMARLRVQGAFASLESDTAGNVVTVLTRNLSEFVLHLPGSPVAAARSVVVYADGFPCYEGPAGDHAVPRGLVANRAAMGLAAGRRGGRCPR